MHSRDKARATRQPSLLANIQYLRAVAAYMVVLYHARLLTPIGQMLPFDAGRAGVDIFFVISGFIIQHVAARDDAGRPGTFLAKRAIRILPLYWLLTLLIAAGGQVVPALAGSGGVPDGSRIVRSLLFLPYRDDAGEIHPVLFLGWTLNYEMFFYVLFAAGLLIVRPALRLAAVSGVLLLLVVAGLATGPESAAGITYTSPLLLEFGAGLWLGHLWERYDTRVRARGLRVPAAIAMALGFAALPAGDLLWPGVPQIVRWGLPALAIVAAALAFERSGADGRAQEGAGGGADRRLALLLGEASYAIYLVHPFVIKAVSLVYARLGATALPMHVLALLATLLVVGVVGVGFHLLVERPLVRLLRHRLLPRARPAVAAGEVEPKPV